MPEEVRGVEGDPEVEELVRVRSADVQRGARQQRAAGAEELERHDGQTVERDQRDERERNRGERGRGERGLVARLLGRKGQRRKREQAAGGEEVERRPGHRWALVTLAGSAQAEPLAQRGRDGHDRVGGGELQHVRLLTR